MLSCRLGALLSFDMKLPERTEVRIESDEGVFLMRVIRQLGAYRKLEADEFFLLELGVTALGVR